MSDTIVDLKSNTNFVCLKNLQDEYVVPRTNLAAVDFTAGNNIGVSGNVLYVKDATADDIIYGTSGSGVVTPAALKVAMQENLLANANAATVDEILSGSTGQMIDPNGLKSALTVAQAADVTTLGATTMGGDVSSLNYLDTFTLIGTWDNNVNPNEYVLNKYGFGINGTGDYDPTKYPKYADGLKYLFIMDIKLVGGSFASIYAMNNGARQELLIDGGALSDYEWHRYAFEFDSNAAYFIINITKNSSVQLKNVRQYEVTALTDDAIKALAGFEAPDDFEYSHIVDQNMINPWLQIIDMKNSPEVLVYPGLSYKVNAQNNNVKLSVPSIPANKSGLDSYVELYVGGEGSVAVQRPLVLGSTITPYSTNQCTVKFRDGRAVLTIDEVSQDYVVTVTSGTEGSALEGSLYYGLVNSTANQIAFNSGLDGQVISLPASATVGRALTVYGNGSNNTILDLSLGAIRPVTGGDVTVSDLIIRDSVSSSNILESGQNTSGHLTVTDCVINGNTTSSWNLILSGNAAQFKLSRCQITNNKSSQIILRCQSGRYGTTAIEDCYFSDNIGTAVLNVYGDPTKVTVTGSTFYSNSELIQVDVDSTLTLSSYNLINSKITGLGTTTLTATSVLDLSNNTHAAVASGGTVSAAAGAKIIALGGNTVTISANTSGTYLLNNGTITSDVYVVTVGGSSTGSGSLIYGMTASNAGNILFDSGVDGSTVTLSGCTFYRTVNIVGNGPDNNIITGDINYTKATDNYAKTLSLQGLKFNNFHGSLGNNCWLIDCEFGGTVSGWNYTDSSASAYLTNYQSKLYRCKCNNVYFAVNNVFRGTVFDNCDFIGCSNGTPVYEAYNTMTVTNCRFINNTHAVQNYGLIQRGEAGTEAIISNCYFSNPGAYNAILLITRVGNSPMLIAGSTFATSGDNILMTGNASYSPWLRLQNDVLNSTIYSASGTVSLVADSTLDISSNTNSVVVYGSNPTTASIKGTTINVVASTASDAAVSGTATVRYKEGGIYKERTISGGGAGYIMRNNGAWGVPVTVASGTASGSLYDLLVNGTATDITFAPVVDGSTVTAPLVSGTSISRAISINGAGSNVTTVKMDNPLLVNSVLAVSDINLNGWLFSRNAQTYINNIKFIGVTARNIGIQNNSYAIIYGSNGGSVNNSTFENCSVPAGGWGIVVGVESINNCTFNDCTAYLGNLILTYPRACAISASTFTRCEHPINVYYPTGSTVSDCYITGSTTMALNVGNRWGGSGTAYISGSTFATAADTILIEKSGTTSGAGFVTGVFSNNIFNGAISVGEDTTASFSGTNILNSTVSGAGTVVFADGATVTSPIPSGGTIGTGVISVPYITANAGTQKYENITFTGCNKTDVSNGEMLFLHGELNNCLITGNTVSGPATGQWSTVVRTGSTPTSIIGSTITDNKATWGGSGTGEYTMFYSGTNSDIRHLIKDSIITGSIYVFKATIDLQGTQTISNLMNSGGGQYYVHIIQGSTITCNSMYSYAANSGSLSIGDYDSDGIWHETGTAVFITGSVTRTLAGHGNTIRADSTDFTIVS